MHFISHFYISDLEEFSFSVGEWSQDIVFGPGLNAFCLFIVVSFFQLMLNILYNLGGPWTNNAFWMGMMYVYATKPSWAKYFEEFKKKLTNKK